MSNSIIAFSCSWSAFLIFSSIMSCLVPVCVAIVDILMPRYFRIPTGDDL